MHREKISNGTNSSHFFANYHHIWQCILYHALVFIKKSEIEIYKIYPVRRHQLCRSFFRDLSSATAVVGSFHKYPTFCLPCKLVSDKNRTRLDSHPPSPFNDPSLPSNSILVIWLFSNKANKTNYSFSFLNW